jgi:serine protease
MAIAGIRHAGTKVGFSSLGTQVALSAPGGNCVNTTGACLFSLDTTTNAGTTTPTTSGFTDMTNTNLGTSFSAPIVSGIAGLMLSVNGNLKSSQLIARLQEGSTTFPTSSDPTIPTCQIPSNTTGLQTSECNCTTSTCGAGMANAAKAVQAALRPIAAVAASTTTSATPGTALTLNASSSAAACNHTITSYSWTTLSGTNTGGIASANTSMPTVMTPAAGSTYTVQLTITDDAGLTDTANVVVSSTGYTSSAPTTAGTTACLQAVSYSAPATVADSASSGNTTTPTTSSSGGGGGGGALDWLVLLMLALPVLYRAFYRPAMRSAVSSQDF